MDKRKKTGAWARALESAGRTTSRRNASEGYAQGALAAALGEKSPPWAEEQRSTAAARQKAKEIPRDALAKATRPRGSSDRTILFLPAFLLVARHLAGKIGVFGARLIMTLAYAGHAAMAQKAAKETRLRQMRSTFEMPSGNGRPAIS